MEVQGKTFRHWKKKLGRIPTEDSFSTGIIVKDKLCVADGVTRDPFEVLPDLKTLRGQFQFAWNYPKPSPAKVAADIFTSTIPFVLKDYFPQNRNEFAVYESFKEANHEIREWNNKNIPCVDYLVNDFAGCVGACAAVVGDVVYYGFITDSGIAVFNEEGNLQMRTENQGPNKHDKYIWQDERLKDTSWRNPEVRKIIRSEYRNKSYQEHSFGVLTGEENAMEYVRTGKWEISRGENLFVYTDGLEKTIYSPEFSKAIRDGNESDLFNLCQRQVKSEGTMIRYKH